MSVTKKQHYVPKFYLSNFTPNGSVNVFDKKGRRVFGASIDDVAQERYFYAVPTEGECNEELLTSVEKFLAEIDNASKRAIDSLLRNIEASKTISVDGFPKYVLNDEDKVSLAVFMVFQDLRTREFREGIAQMDYQMSRSLLDWVIRAEGKAKHIGKYDIEIPPEREALTHLHMLTDHELHEELLDHALGKHWMIGYNVGSRPLITSDHPVTMKGRNPYPVGKRVAAWGAPFTEITVPLSPKVALLLMCDRFFDNSPGSFLTRQWTENRVRLLNDENVIYCNHLQVLKSHQYLYSGSDDFHDAEEILKKDPEVGNPNRRRAEISGKTYPLPQTWGSRPKKFVKKK